MLKNTALQKAPVRKNRGLALVIFIVAEIEIAAVTRTPALLFGTIAVRTFRLGRPAVTPIAALRLTAGTTVAPIVQLSVPIIAFRATLFRATLTRRPVVRLRPWSG